MCDTESEKGCVCARERERESVCVSVCVCVRVCDRESELEPESRGASSVRASWPGPNLDQTILESKLLHKTVDLLF